MSRIATCGHPTSSRRGPLGPCDRCRPLALIALRLGQAALVAEADGLPLLAAELRAIAADPAGRNASLAAARAEHALATERLELMERPGGRDRLQRGLQDRPGHSRATGRVLQHSAVAVGSA